MDKLIKNLLENYLKEKNLSYDTLRDVNRVEIPASFSLHVTDKRFLKKLADLVVSMQKSDGFWEEFSYEKDDAKVGFYGAVPTAISVISLVRAYQILKNEKYLNSVVKGADYLYSQEKGGYFRKALINKHNVLNTNLLASLALMKVTEILKPKSRRILPYKWASSRAIIKTIESQYFSGAYPYVYCGLGIPFLYHSMTLALLINLYKYFSNDLLSYSISKGYNYLIKRVVNSEGIVQWDKENFHDKKGAIWVYGWNYYIFKIFRNFEMLNNTIKHLRLNNKRNFLNQSDFKRKSDLFYTTWVLFGINLDQNLALSLNKKLLLNFIILKGYFIKTKNLYKFLKRKFFSHFDEGPIEDN